MKVPAAVQQWIVPVGAVVVTWEVCGRHRHRAALPVDADPRSWRRWKRSRATANSALRWPRASIASSSASCSAPAPGSIAGLAAGLIPGVRNFFDPLVAFLFAIPKIAFLPVFLLLFGLGHASKISIIAFSSFFPVFIASRHAVVSVNKVLLWAGENMGAPAGTMFFRVIVPASAPQLFSGIRIGLAHAFVILFAAELLGSQSGLGTLIAEGEQAARFDLMFAGIVTFAVLGFLSDRILMAIRRRVLRGQMIGTVEEAVR